jgi:hypothetical protein
MTSSKIHWKLMDNGCRRSRIDRRYFSYSSHIPERRCGKDRRAYKDRISGLDIRFIVIESQQIDAPDEKREDIDLSSIKN